MHACRPKSALKWRIYSFFFFFVYEVTDFAIFAWPTFCMRSRIDLTRCIVVKFWCNKLLYIVLNGCFLFSIFCIGTLGCWQLWSSYSSYNRKVWSICDTFFSKSLASCSPVSVSVNRNPIFETNHVASFWGSSLHELKVDARLLGIQVYCMDQVYV